MSRQPLKFIKFTVAMSVMREHFQLNADVNKYK